MWLKIRMYLLVAVLFGILYAVIVGIGTWLGIGGVIPYLILAIVFLGIQYLIGPSLVAWTMKVKWVSEKKEPELHQMVADLAASAGLPKPRVGISEISMPNAFAFGRSQRDGRVCVTRGLLNTVNKDELKAVLGHEMSHLKNHDMAVITLLSAIPMVLYWIAWTFMMGGSAGNRRRSGNYTALIGMGAFLLYFLTNLLVLYGSRIREYAADSGSVKLGNQPNYLASALYKLTRESASSKNKAELKRVEPAKAFFISDPSSSWMEVREVAQVDRGSSGTITRDDLMDLRQKKVHLSMGARLKEIFMSHPATLNRIKQLSNLAA